tara:strand:+ start:873 stop:1157 length:285 start_codon:yes stop_codon:yes gene_type:complete
MAKSENGNVVYTCGDCGKDTYHLIKNTMHNYHGYVYVWFKDKTHGDEKMWVKITNGNADKGFGRLRNKPIKLDMKYNDKVKFETDKEGITYGHK